MIAYTITFWMLRNKFFFNHFPGFDKIEQILVSFSHFSVFFIGKQMLFVQKFSFVRHKMSHSVPSILQPMFRVNFNNLGRPVEPFFLLGNHKFAFPKLTSVHQMTHFPAHNNKIASKLADQLK